MQTWTDRDVTRAVKALERSETVAQAVKRLGVSDSALRSAFQRARERGLDVGSPADHLTGKRAPEPATKRHDGRTILIMPDTHAPYHSEAALSVFLNVAKAIKPDALVILGDLFDCYSVSRFPKDPSRKARLRDELADGMSVPDRIEALGIPSVYFLEGNHELRLKALVCNDAPALDGMVSIQDELRVKERGWHWVNYKKSLQLGRMRYSHDFGRHGVNAGRQGLLDVGANIAFGHTHKLGTWYQGTIADGAHVAINCGWLGDVEMVDYRHADIARREYQLGFGLVDEAPDGCVWPQAVAIVNNTAMVRGRRIGA